MREEVGEASVNQNTLSPTADMGGGTFHRMSMRRISSDFTNVISRLSYVFGENIDLSEDEDNDEATQVASVSIPVPTPLPFTGKLRIERDYSLGEGCQFSMDYPSKLEEKISLAQFQESMSKINLLLYRAESNWARHSLDHLAECLSLYTFPLCFGTSYQKRMEEFDEAIQTENDRVFAPAGLKLWNPRRCAFLYLEIEFLKEVYQPDLG